MNLLLKNVLRTSSNKWCCWNKVKAEFVKKKKNAWECLAQQEAAIFKSAL